MYPTQMSEQDFISVKKNSPEYLERKNVPRFLVIEILEGKTFNEISPFLIERFISQICTPKTVKKTEKWNAI